VKRKKSPEQIKEAKDHRRLSIEVKEGANALSSTRKCIRGAKELVKMSAACGNWQAYILSMLWTQVTDGSPGLGCDSGSIARYNIASDKCSARVA
jgi:hypothetical protein